MPDYETLRLIWWLLLGIILIGFAVMDGFDLGVGALFRFIGQTDEERRAILESIEPVWEGNQVWFVVAGGCTFAAWPLLYATSFSGFYFAMFLVLGALIVRPVGFGFRNKLTDARWRESWDWALCFAGVMPSFLLGVAFGNLFLGVPFHFDIWARPQYTGGFFELLRPFALLVGVVSLAMFVMHGGVYAALKVEAPMGARAARVACWAALALLAAFTVAGLWAAWGMDGLRITSALDANGPSNPLRKTVSVVAGAWLQNYRSDARLWAAPAAVYGGVLILWAALRAGRFGLAFIASSIVQAGVILTGGFSLFPFLLPSSTEPRASLTIWDASSSRLTLFIMLIVVLILLPLILAYTVWVFRVLKGRITLEHVREQHGLY